MFRLCMYNNKGLIVNISATYHNNLHTGVGLARDWFRFVSNHLLEYNGVSYINLIIIFIIT